MGKLSEIEKASEKQKALHRVRDSPLRLMRLKEEKEKSETHPHTLVEDQENIVSVRISSSL